MAISIKGVNTGVIRKSNNFIALALKIKEPRNKESLFFMSVMELRDLLIALESRLHQKHKLDAAARLQYEQARDKVIRMAENIPEILVDELKNADINRRVNTLELTDNQGENITFVLTLHDGNKCELVVNELQIEMLARAIIHAINNAEMRELALRITSLLDFLPLYRTLTARKMAIWNMTPLPNRNGNITCLTIIWRCFTALKMKVAKNNLAAQW